MTTAVRAVAVRREYGNGAAAVTALDSVSVAVQRGCFMAVVGPSGSGKSTLLHCMAGLDAVDSGEVYLGETELTRLSEQELTRLRRDRVGFVFQSFNLVPVLTAGENILLPLRLAGRPPDPEWTDRVIGAVGLRDRLRHRPSQLSGGQQQRVAVARALVTRPEVVFADEPTGNLDSRAGADLMRFLRRSVGELGQTVVMVTHNAAMAAYADRTLVLCDGRVVDDMCSPTADQVLERMHALGSSAMITLTVKGMLAHWRRALLTGMAAVVGVAIVSGTLIVSDTADRLGSRDSDLHVVRQIMLVAGGVTLLVGMFIVSIMMSVTVAQRTRELGLLRCIGASTSQLRRSVLLESLLTGAVNALAGLLLGFGVASALRALINTGTFAGQLPGHTFTLTPRTVIAVLMVGCVATVLSGLGPARRASRVAPMAALLELPPAPSRRRRMRMVAGTLVLGGGLATLPVAVATGQGPLILAGAALALAGLRLLGPLLAGRLASAVGLPVAGALRTPGVLGRLNAVRNPERTAATASALAIGLALLAFITILSASTKAPLLHEYARDRADFQLWPAASQEASDQKTGPRGEPMNPALVARLRALPEVAAVAPVRCVPGTRADQRAVCAADPATIAEVKDLEMVSGSLADLGPGALGVSQRDATDAGWTTGAAVTIHAAGGSRAFTVKAIYRTTTTFGSYLMAPADLAQLGAGATTPTVYIRAAVADPATARAAVARVAADYPGVEIHDRAEFHRSDIKQIDNATAIYRGLTGLAALVGLFGIVGTLALSIVERRRELGLLRAVGMQRRQVRSMIRAEAVIVALVGAVLGIGLGALFGWAAARVFEHSSSPTEFTVPVGGLATVAVLVVLAGVAAAVLPARLASRVNVLRAIAAE